MAIELDRNVRRFLALSDLKPVPHAPSTPQVSKWQPRHAEGKKAHRGGKASRAQHEAKRAERLQSQQAKAIAARNAIALQSEETQREREATERLASLAMHTARALQVASMTAEHHAAHHAAHQPTAFSLPLSPRQDVSSVKSESSTYSLPRLILG
jgi:hypothetical protein